MRHLVRKFIRHARSFGLRNALAKAYGHIVHGPVEHGQSLSPQCAGARIPKLSILKPQTDIIRHYSDILAEEIGCSQDLKTANPAPNTLQWVIPNFGFGSGGHLNIFRFINLLADRGYEQRLVILPPHNWTSPAQAKEKIEEWYTPLNASVALDVGGFAPSHITIATGWQTAYWVAKYQATRDRFYFVQDFEPSFYPNSSEYFLAENTYRLGLKGITAGSWLSKRLAKDYGMTCGDISFSCDKNFYQQQARKKSPNFNLLFYSRHVTKRRLFELGFSALAIVAKKHPEMAVIFAGGDVSGFKIPFHHLNAGELTLKELPALYSQCDLALVLSGTNLSLLPMELAACNCPVVLNDSPSANWLLPRSAAFYAPLDPEGMAKTISGAIRNTKSRETKRRAAYKFAQASSWEHEANKFVDLLNRLKN